MIQRVTGNHKTKIFLIRKYARFYSCSNSFLPLIRYSKLHFLHRYFSPPLSAIISKLNIPHSNSIIHLLQGWLNLLIKLTILFWCCKTFIFALVFKFTFNLHFLCLFCTWTNRHCWKVVLCWADLFLAFSIYNCEGSTINSQW